MISEITPIILAAGASSRMGRVKALCDFDGKTALELVLEACLGLGTPVVVLGAAREEIESRVNVTKARVVWNEEFEAGQTSSLKVALHALSPAAKAFLIFPVDHPVVGLEEVDVIVHRWRTNRDSKKKIFIPSYSLQRGHPVLCDRTMADEFLSLADDAPARTVVNARPTRICYVPFDHAYTLMDMDTPEDYLKCLEAYRTRQRERKR